MESPQRSEWLEAMKAEIRVMEERQVWELKEIPTGKMPVGCRWVFTIKKNEKGELVRFKARLVAQGYKQIKGDSYDETFSPVVNFSLIRFFFSLLVCNLGWLNTQCDINSAYLYAPLAEDIYMNQPPGFIKSNHQSSFCKLKRAIYGLHQSGRMWFHEIHRVLLDLGFKKLESCNCIYIYENSIVLLLYVDDLVVLGRTQQLINGIIKRLEGKFDLKILGPTKKLLGIEFEEVGEEVHINQTKYIEEVCDRFRKYHFPISSLPISKGSVYSKTQCPTSDREMTEMNKIPYRNLLGCLSFIASRTRPDICYGVNIFSQFQSNPGIIHWEGMLKLLGYLSHTKEYKLKLSCKKLEITAYTDADYAANRDDRTSLGGQIFLLDKAPIEWKTFKQKCVSLSTMESEFVALTDTSRGLIWFDRIFKEIHQKGIIKDNPFKSILLVDNQAALEFVKSPIESNRSRHIDVKLFFIRDLIFQEIFSVEYVRSKDNLADVFTKPQTKFDLQKFNKNIFKS